MTSFFLREKKSIWDYAFGFYPIPSGDAGCVCCGTTEPGACCWELAVLDVTGDSRLSNNCDNHFFVDWSSLRTASWKKNS